MSDLESESFSTFDIDIKITARDRWLSYVVD